MKEPVKNKLVLISGCFGIILTLLGSGLAIINGIAMIIAYTFVYGTGLLTIIAGVVLFITTIVGIVAEASKNANVSLAAAIMSLISSTTVACCLGIRYGDTGIYTLSILSALCGFAAFLLFTTLCVNTPASRKYISSEQFQKDKSALENEIQTEMKILRQELRDGEISEEEYSQAVRQLDDRKNAYLRNAASTGVVTTVTKKQKRKAFLIPIAVMAAIFIAVIPSIFFGTCNFAYNRLLVEMSDMHEQFCSCYSSYERYNSLLPAYYKDVKKIREEMEFYEVRFCMSAIRGEINTVKSHRGIFARAAYKRLTELQAEDSRWGFESTVLNGSALITNALWQGDGVYFEISYDKENDCWLMNSNVPSFADGADLLNHPLRINCGDDGYYVGYGYGTAYQCYKISDFDYDVEKSEFSISLYSHKDGNMYSMTLKEDYEWSDLKQSMFA